MSRPKFLIDKGVPIAPKRFAPTGYPWPDMQVRDSFAVPDDQGRSGGNSRARQRLGNSAFKWAKKHAPDRKFTTRCLLERGVRVVRVWRIA